MSEEIPSVRPFTLREMLGRQTKITGDVEILNECNETLVRLVDTEAYVCPITNVLSDELLDRAVIEYGCNNAITFVVEGVDDAE